MKKKVLTKQQLQQKIIGKIQGDVIFFFFKTVTKIEIVTTMK